MHARRMDNLGKRNVRLASGVTLIALTFLFYPGTEGMAWMMWRDTPLLAGAMAVAGIALLISWWRTPRS